jgi:hypothetical protein
MTGRMRGTLAALALTLGLVSPASAGWFFSHGHDDCPPSQYSCLHYFAPSLYRYRAFHSDHPEYLYAPVPHPEMVSYDTFAAPCPAVDPAILARYSLRYAYIGSTYQKPPAEDKDKDKDKAADTNGPKTRQPADGTAPKKDGTTPKRENGAAPRPERLPPAQPDK